MFKYQIDKDKYVKIYIQIHQKNLSNIGLPDSLNELMNEWISDEAVYRTAPATPGLLINYGFRQETIITI